MKAIMISVKPKYCALEMNGIKSIEVRKNKALANAIKKLIAENGYADIYVYCSKGKYEMGKFNSDKKYHEIRDDCSYAGGWLRGLPDETVNGKVVFKFHCYKVEEILIKPNGNYYTNTLSNNKLLTQSCLSQKEILEYANCHISKISNCWFIGYAIHISDLEIFDKPKELSEFKQPRDSYGKVNWNTNEYYYMDLTKAPQNFCYVEVESL